MSVFIARTGPQEVGYASVGGGQTSRPKVGRRNNLDDQVLGCQHANLESTRCCHATTNNLKTDKTVSIFQIGQPLRCIHENPKHTRSLNCGAADPTLLHIAPTIASQFPHSAPTVPSQCFHSALTVPSQCPHGETQSKTIMLDIQ